MSLSSARSQPSGNFLPCFHNLNMFYITPAGYSVIDQGKKADINMKNMD